ncbi:MAG: small ribosomal subunit Rsm22 family protein [Chlamydiia bacterium]
MEKKGLKNAFQAINQRYREEKAKLGFQNGEELEAYFLYRTPATQAVLKKVLAHLEGERYKTALELGSGPGSSYPVLKDLFCEKIVYIEKETGFHREYPGVTWIFRDFLENFDYPESDLVLFSYSLGELNSTEQFLALEKGLRAMKKRIVIVEPGTPAGFKTLLQARDYLIEKGCTIEAPCYHSASCPKKEKPWCHFSVRLQRSRIHRQIKGGTLGYEDEKYCYIVASLEPLDKEKFTILDTPKVEKHRLQMNLCTAQGEKIFECKAKSKELFKILKKKGWGENLDSSILSGIQPG